MIWVLFQHGMFFLAHITDSTNPLNTSAVSQHVAMKEKTVVLFLGLVFTLGAVSGASLNSNGESSEMAELRVAHMSPNAEPMDIFVNNERIAEGIGFGDSVNADIESGTYQVRAAPTGEGVEEASVSKTVNLEAGSAYTTVITNRKINLDMEVLSREMEAPSDEARVRIAHFSPDLTGLNAELDGLEADLAYREVSTYSTVTPGEYTVEVTEEGIGGAEPNQDVTLDEGTVYTAFIAGDATRDSRGLQIISLSDGPEPEEVDRDDGNGDRQTGNAIQRDLDLGLECRLVDTS